MAGCLKLDPAKFRNRVSLQSLARTGDGQGGYTESWATVAALWASIEPLKGYEKFQAMQTETPVTHKVTLRYRSGVTAANRLVYSSRIFEVKEVLNLNEDNSFLQLLCVESGVAGEDWEDIGTNWEYLG